MTEEKNSIRVVGIVGAGTMGRRIAFACILGKRRTVMFDCSYEVADVAVSAVADMVQQRVNDGRLPVEALEMVTQLSVASTLEACVSLSDLVIETVPENIDLKKKIFAEIDVFLSPHALLATNTSSIPGSWLASSTRCPERVFNANFGTPDHLKVEVMSNPATAPRTLRVATSFLRELGLIPIVVRGELVGYGSNRIWRAVKKEVLFLLAGGHLTADEIDRAWMLDWGTPIGPCGLMDKIGLDVVRDIEMVYWEASGDPSDEPPRFLHDMIAAGKLGVKTGRGFYSYPDPAFRRVNWLTGDLESTETRTPI